MQHSVAYLGPRASYTHQAALDTFGEEEYEVQPCHTIEDIFEAVQTGLAYRGVVPFENSTNGSVIFTLDLFADTAGKYPDIEVCSEVYIDVHHCLLGHTSRLLSAQSPASSGCATPTTSVPNPRQPRTQPKVHLGHIQKIYSHPQAWGQCNSFLSYYLKGIERQDVSSTSKAAEIVAADPTRTTAAISSIVAAHVHGLDILAESIEDRSNNTTRFFVIRKGGDPIGPAAKDNSLDQQKEYKTMVSFTVDHENPGALANALAVFQKHQLNLTSINARPSGLAPWNYKFLVEFRGSRNGPYAGDVNAALRDLDVAAKQSRWLGSWQNRLSE